ncbi:interferon-induced protein 44-like isoform X1 [Tachysurus fulvidraco]|uniref:interferon-induced protein 44-like isoform X1 n=1 Tax=Tachysurus fulvidraco TaxID=1234273 RepID=UPI001FEE4567|nr:interferon-induced protein 44-like isoform X1 [Tachysurus fulvidraco]XP_047671048.1 interferon-induced protein 44-like isoform X1 [Tachysurus fulvidraco]
MANIVDAVIGLFITKPEFVTVLPDKQVVHGQDFILSCKAKTEDVTVLWEKRGQKLLCVEGKHKMSKIGTNCVLEISNAEDGDEGNYTVTLSNKLGSTSCSAFVRIIIKEWRTVDWKKERMLKSLKTFQICNEVQELRFLLCGPVGTGKSSTINTIRSIFEGRQFIDCLAASGTTTSHTLRYERYQIANEEGSFPFAFNDIMGAETDSGILNEDIISALKGHIKEGYTFNSETPLSESSLYYNKNPTLSDQMHCLVFVMPADKISTQDPRFLQKMKSVVKTASSMGIPHVVFMTRVDHACLLTKENLQNVYKSKKIKDNMEKCSNELGVTVNRIFPVLNYHEQIHMNEDINCLMLDALTQIIHFANDYVLKKSSQQQSKCE